MIFAALRSLTQTLLSCGFLSSAVLGVYSLRSKRSGIVEIKSQKHGRSIGSSTQNPPIKTPEARSPFPDFSYQRL
ncbi:hypothetical protein B9Z19DRAFT_88910 [Tuber borchii]|uniref:Uncharacterized protein n=1 Tax=Tuber borchii TaxID=42251 RepID=A0A2T6ZS41_TUBBO|nr:hypothetical protein B9Z19DRAFT_88910 [Tuber borchii]